MGPHIKIEDDDVEIIKVEWELNDQVARLSDVSRPVAAKVVSLLDSGNTVPFIARYRKECTGGLTPEQLNTVKRTAERMREVQTKVSCVAKKLSIKGDLTQDIKQTLQKCTTVEEVNHVAEPFKEKGPKTLAGKAIAAGLQSMADSIMKDGVAIGDYDDYVRSLGSAVKMPTSMSVKQGLVYIIADGMYKNLDIVRFAEARMGEQHVLLTCTEKKRVRVKKEADEAVAAKEAREHQRNVENLRNYLQFSRDVHAILPHQTLAINRGEAQQVLSVSVVIPGRVETMLRRHTLDTHCRHVHPSQRPLVEAAFDSAWQRFIHPHLQRTVRSQLSARAECASVEVFTGNLRRLLMTAPLRRPADYEEPELVLTEGGQCGDRLPVMAIDPGYAHGCKWACVDATGQPQSRGILHLQRDGQLQTEQLNFISCMKSFGITTVVIGNGQGHREAERWLVGLKRRDAFHPLRVRYTFVSEAGASVYSASEQAAKELPQMDVVYRGAVSLARRMQDPLHELVKISPEHLGVGMYQHDVASKRLVGAVDDLVEECISCVGLDLNAAPAHMLSRVAGLSSAKAERILLYRQQHGRFHCRQQLKQVKGIGEITFNQCAGFLRVKAPVDTKKTGDKVVTIDLVGNNGLGAVDAKMDAQLKLDPHCATVPGNEENVRPGLKREATQLPMKKQCDSEEDEEVQVVAAKRRRKRSADQQFTPNPLDQTAVHPMTYHLATKIIKAINWTVDDIGKVAFRARVKKLLEDPSLESFLEEFVTEEFGQATLKDIVEYLSRPLDFDERKTDFLPYFREDLTDVEQLRVGTQLRGTVRNVTSFGCFVDCGFTVDVFLHRSQYPPPVGTHQQRTQRHKEPQIGDHLKGVVQSITREPHRTKVAMHRSFFCTPDGSSS